MNGRWTCEQCGDRFDREKSRDRPIRFCAVSCYHKWRKANNVTGGQFASGQAPWNKGVKGLQLSPQTQFKKGRESERRLPLGAVTIRKRKKDKHSRAFVKIAEPNVWRERALVVWEAENGPISSGYIIHHRDRDALNDTIDNLEAMTRAAHINEHRRELKGASQ